MKNLLIAIIVFAGACVPPAAGPAYQPQPQPQPPPYEPLPPPPPAPAWDSRGWTMLGTQTVQGRTDRDVINVGRYQGRFDQLTMVVVDSDLELLDFVVVFGNNERWSPKLAHYFREGQRTRVIDLPGDDRLIARIEMAYRNLPGGGRAKVEVWGRDTGRRPPPPPAPAWDSRGWTMLGTQTVQGRTDRDVINVGRYQGRFDQLTMVVMDSDLELLDFVVVFGNNERWSPKLAHYFREGQRTRVIDLPGDDRLIARIEMAYRNLPGGGRAKVEVWGRDTGRRPPPPPAPAWDSRGWTMLGTQTVQGRTDRDVINVGRYQGRFDQLTMVVVDSDLELLDFVVVFGNNERWSPKLAHYFREGQRTRVIDLPGDDRLIARIEMAYKNLPGGGRAKVEVWGRDTGRRPPPPPPPAPAWDSKGWTILGTQTVQGRTDRDVINVGRYQGRFDQLTVVVTDSDLELLDFVIVFGNKERWSPKLAHYFREGQRTRVIDLPGDDRSIARIEMTYKNLPGGGRAKVEVWGRDIGRRPRR